MKKFFKSIAYISIIPIILIGVLLLTAWLYRDKVVGIVMDEINQMVEADVRIDSYKLNPFRSFPGMNLEIGGLNIVGTDLFQGDTLVSLGVLNVEVDLWSLFRQPIRVKSIGISDSKILAKVLEDGSANWLIFPEDENSEQVSDPDEPLQFSIGEISLNETEFVYQDLEAQIYSTLANVKAEFVLQNDGQWDSQITVDDWDANFGSLHVLQKMNAAMLADMSFDLDSFKLDIINSKVELNTMPFQLAGYVSMPDSSILMDLAFQSDKSTFKDLLSLVPFIYRYEFDDLEAAGNVILEGTVKGVYDAIHFPKTKLNLNIDDGTFSWPDLPKNVSNVFVDLAIQNAGGTVDGTVVDLSTFRARLGEDPVDLTFYLKDPESNPYVKTKLKTQLDLYSWREFIPLEKGDELGGTISADLNYSGRLATVQNEKFENIDAKGSLAAKDIVYKGSMFANKLEAAYLKIQLTPEVLLLDKLSMKTGGSDIRLSGSMSNYLPYFFEKGNLIADFNLISGNLNANDWMSKEGKTTDSNSNGDTIAVGLPQIPQHMEAKITLQIGALTYDKYDLKDVQGALTIRDGIASMVPVRFQMLGGAIEMKGRYYSGNEASSPNIDLNLELRDVALDQTVHTFNTVQRLAPIASRCSGIYSAGLKVKGNLTEDFSPDISTLNGLMQFRTEKLQVEQADIVQQIGQLTGSGYFNSPTLSKVNALIEFNNGEILLKPFNTKVKNARLQIGGLQGLDGSIDYNIGVDLPSKDLNLEKSHVAKQLFDLPIAQTMNLKWPERIKFDVNLDGTLKNPKVSLNVKEQLLNLEEELVKKVKDKATEEIDKKRAELIYKAEVQARILLEEANKQGDLLVAEAQKQADQMNARANEQIDELKSEADRKADDLIAKAGANPIKKLAAREAADLIRSEAQKNADKLKNEAAVKANKVVVEAKRQKNKLVEEARKEGEAMIEEARTREI